MDTTPEYKKQCVGAFPDIGFIFDEGPDNLLIVDGGEVLSSWARTEQEIQRTHGRIFTIHGQLYRQDQLQEIVIEPNVLVGYISQFHDFVMESFYDSASPSNKWMGNSMEALWLAFVMHEKFNKTWDSDKEKWVKEG